MSTKPDPAEPATTPAAAPGAVAQNLELVIERLKDIRHLGPQTHFSDLAKEALVCARAALAAVPKHPIPPLGQSLQNSGLEPDWNGHAMAEKKDAAQGDAKHLVDAVTAVMSKHGLIDHLTLGATERFCDELLATFTANAEQGVVLPSPITPAPQGYAWRGMNPDLSDAINKLALNDAVAYASLNAGIVQGLSQADTLAHIVLNLATSKGQLEAELYRLAALSPPGKAAL